MTIKCSKCQTENTSDSEFCKKCATPLHPSKEVAVSQTETLKTPIKELTSGSTFAKRYQVIEELGKGGMGRVYKVLDTEIREKVALKLLKPEIAADEETIERFRNEMKFARKISHRNVCRMHDLSKEEGSYYITMEYVAGEDLKTMIRMAAGLSIGAVLSIGKQVCDGLAEAHSLGVVHRDLKPQNIMIDKGGNAKIMDFGIARSMREKGITGGGIIIGTPEYMSPEQTEAKEVDQRSDIYSLGVILYEMATGHVPFEGETALSVVIKHKTEIPKDPKAINPNIPDDLTRLILRCLEKDKTKRYQTAAEVRSELEKIEKGIPTAEKVVPSRKPITSREITLTFRLKKLLIPAVIVLALIITGFLIFRFLPKKGAPPISTGKPSLAIIYFENMSNDEQLEGWRTGLAELLITDLSQSKYLTVLSSDRVQSILKKLGLLDVKKYSSEDLTQIADQAGVSFILKGSYIKAGENILITAALQKPQSGEQLKSIRVESKGEQEITAKIDELTKEIKLSLNLTSEQMATDIDKSLEKITSDSSEALKYYLEGRKIHQTAPQRSIELLKRAVDIDPSFAMAYRSLGMAYGNLGYQSEAAKYHQKALELRDRVSERERLQIEGAFYWRFEKTFDKAIQAYKSLLELYPEDYTANFNLGCIYRDLEEWDKAIEYIERAKKINAASLYVSANLPFLFLAKGMPDRANAALDEYSKNNPDHETIRVYRARLDVFQRKFQSALTEAEKAYFLNPTSNEVIIVRGNIYQCIDDFAKSEIEYSRLFDLGGHISRIRAYDRLAALYLSAGKFEKSVEQLAKEIEWARTSVEKTYEPTIYLDIAYRNMRTGNYALALKNIDEAWKSAEDSNSESNQMRALHLRGVVQARMKSFSEARQTAVQLKERIGKWLNSKFMRYHDHLLGTIELESGNFNKAIEYFDKAFSLLPYESRINEHAFFIDSLARACFQKKDFVRAKKEYEKITQLTGGRLDYGDIYAQSYYMLGKINEQLGDKTKAAENYQKFLDLWKNADPGLPEVEDARKRLSGLR